MSVEYIKRLAGPFIGDGSGQKVFTFGFLIFDEGDVSVSIADEENAVPRTLTRGEDFSVQMNEDQAATPGGTITLLMGGLANGEVLAIGSSVPYTQTLTLTNYTRFPPERITKELDRIVVQIQQLKDGVDRSVKTDETDTMTPQELKTSLLDVAKNALSIANEKAAEAARYASQAKESATFSANTVKDLPAQTAASVEEVKSAASSEGSKQVGLVTAAGDSKLSAIANAGQEQLDSIVAEGVARKSSVTSEGVKQVDSVNAAGAEQQSAINSTASGQISSIEYEGDRQVARVRAVVDNTFVAEGTGCSQAAWELQSAIQSGTEFTIPSGIKYLVGRNHLRVSWNGLSLYRGRNFEEVGTDDTFSTTIKLLFDASKGDEIEVWVGALGKGDVADAVAIARSAVQLVESLEQKVVYPDEEAAS